MKFSELYQLTKKNKQKLAVLTAYDYSFAKILAKAEIDIILVGDSLANVLLGKRSTVEIGLLEMIYHLKAVRKGAKNTYIMADMPFGSFEAGPCQAMETAVQLIKAGADCVKIEGGAELIPTIEFLTKRGIRVCFHSGLLPQRFAFLGGYGLTAKSVEEQNIIIQNAKLAKSAGADFLLLEAVPSSLAKNIAKAVPDLITIGIGAGTETDGQVLVSYDILGLSDKIPKFAKVFLNKENPSVLSSIAAYVREVKQLKFPSKQQILS